MICDSKVSRSRREICEGMEIGFSWISRKISSVVGRRPVREAWFPQVRACKIAAVKPKSLRAKAVALVELAVTRNGNEKIPFFVVTILSFPKLSIVDLRAGKHLESHFCKNTRFRSANNNGIESSWQRTQTDYEIHLFNRRIDQRVADWMSFISDTFLYYSLDILRFLE